MAGPAVGSASCPSELCFQSTHSFRDRLRALLLLDALLLAPIEDVPLRAGTVACLSLCVSRDGAPPGIRRGQEVFPEARLQAYGFELSSEGSLRYHQGSVERCIARSHWSVSVAGRDLLRAATASNPRRCPSRPMGFLVKRVPANRPLAWH